MSKLAKYIIGIAVAAVILFLIWYFSDIVGYILVSAVLAIIGKPMVDALLRIRIKGRKIPRWFAAFAALVAIWAVAVLFLYLFIPLVFGKLNELSQFDVPSIIAAFSGPLQSLQDFISKYFAIDNDDFSLVKEISQQINHLFNLDLINDTLTSVVTVIADTAIALFSVTFITFFFLKQENLFQNMLVSVFPKRYEQNVIHALESVTKLLIRYFTSILAESTMVMILLSCILMVWGFPPETAFFMGLIVGILNVIPYIGPIIGGILCAVMGIISPLPGKDFVDMVFIVVGSVVAVQLVDNFVLQPWLYSNRVKAHPLEIFLVILIAGSVAGVLGMLLAIPSYTVLRVFAKEFFNRFHIVRKLTENI